MNVVVYILDLYFYHCTPHPLPRLYLSASTAGRQADATWQNREGEAFPADSGHLQVDSCHG